MTAHDAIIKKLMNVLRSKGNSVGTCPSKGSQNYVVSEEGRFCPDVYLYKKLGKKDKDGNELIDIELAIEVETNSTPIKGEQWENYFSIADRFHALVDNRDKKKAEELKDKYSLNKMRIITYEIYTKKRKKYAKFYYPSKWYNVQFK